MAKEKVLTDLQKSFLNHLLGDARGDFRKAMDLAGYSPTVSKAEVMKSLKNEIREAAKDALALASVQASFSLSGAMLDPTAAGTSNVIKAAESILNRVGVKEDDSVSGLPDGAVLILPEKKFTILQVGEKDA